MDDLRLLRSRSAILADVERWSPPADAARAAAGPLGPERDDAALEHDSGELHPLSDLPDPVGAARYLAGRRAVLEIDGERISLYVFRPRRAAEERPPVVLVIHGGPEAQAMLTFNPIV